MPLHLRGLWVVAAVVASIFAAPLVVGGASAVAAKQSNHRPSWTAKPSMDGLSPASPPTAALTATGPSTPVLDDFNRADESPLTGGGNWAELNPFLIQEDLELVNNHVEEIGGCCPGLAARYWTPAVFGPDVEVHARMTSPNLGTGIRLSLRISNPDGNSNGYELVVSHGSPDRWLIRRYSNGFVDAGVGLAAPIREFVLFRAIGNTMEGLGSDDGVNWDSIITWSDSLYQVAGPISIAFDGGNGQQLDDFGGGTLGSPPPGGSQPAQQTFGQFGVGRGPVGNNATATFADPVNTLTGAFVHAETDLALASTGVPFEWTRTYTSADLASGRFGQGWTDTYQASVEILANGDAVVKGDDGQRFTFPSLGGGVFETPPAAMATLETVAGGYQLTTNDQLVYVFDSAGKLLSKNDRNGQGVRLAYDAGGRLQTVTDSAGHVATVSYNAGDLVSGVSLSDGRSVSYGYTGGQLTSFTDVRGKAWQYTYDANALLATIVDPLGHAQVSNVYDKTGGRVTQQTNATGDTTQFAWDEQTQTATVTDPRGHVWKDVYQDGVLAERIDGTGKTTQFGFDGDLNESSVTSPAGETTSMTYDTDGNLLTATAPPSLGSAQKTFVYNAGNDPTTVTDARGTVTSYAYTQAGNVETVTQGGVQQAAYTYDAQGRVLTATDARSNTTTYTYDAAGNVASVTGPDPDGPGPLGPPRTTFTYDSQGNVLTRVDPKGNVAGCGCAGQYTTTFAYNPAGQRLTETDPLGHTSSNAYDDAGRLVSTTDANGHTTSYAYDDANRLLTETAPDPDGAGPQGAPVTTYTYDDAGNKLTETDPRGNTTTFAYDTANRLVSTTAPDPDGAGPQPAPVTTYTYDQNANLASMVEPRGNLAGANPDDYRTTYTYDAAGRLLTTTDPLGHATTNAYDPVGNSAAVTDANGHVTSYTYDYAGRVLTVTAPDPDGAGPLTAPVTTYTYDGAGNRLTRTDTNGHITTWAYDALDRVVSETAPDPDGAGGQTPSVQTMAYDENGNLLSTTDANGNGTPTAGDGTTTYVYDRADRLTGIDYSDSTPDVSFTLDAVGNRLSMADGEGTETRTYDDLDRLLTVVRGSSSFSYTYDAAGNVTHRGALEYGFDALDRLVAVTQDGTALASYGYDAASSQVTHAYPSGYTETRTFDRAGRLSSIEDTRETPGFATQTLVPGSVLEQTKLDGALADIQDDPGDPAAGFDWMTASSPRDDVALRVGFATPASAPVGLQTFRVRVRKQGGSATPTVRLDLYENGVLRASGTPTTVTSSSGQLVSQSFDLDTVSLANPDGSGVELRLVGTHAGNGQARASVDVDAVAWDERFASGPLLLARLVYTRDAVGNPTQLERTGELAGRQTYTYDAMDRLTSVCFQASCPGRGDPFIRWTYDGVGNRLTEQRPSGTTAYTYDAMDRMLTAGSTSYDYDRNGNQTEAGSLSYGYDLANRLVSVSDGTTYRYDGDGVRVATTTPTGEITALWDVNNPTPLLVSEFNLQSSESLVPTGPVSRSYVYGTSLLRQTTTIATTPLTQTTLDLFADALGSVIATSTPAGAQVETAEYEPFGAFRAGSVSSTMRFTGQYHDQTGLYHLRARQYDPETGRFLAVDPADQTVGGGAISAYTYTGNRPTVMNDPSGGFSIRAGGATSITRSLMSTESAQSGYLRIHNDIVNAVGFAVWIAGRVAGVPDMAVTSDGASNAIPGASQVNDGNNGYADLILWAPRDRTALIWEFKAVGQSASRARTQISTYVDRFPRGHTGWTPRPGFRIPSTGAMRVPYRWGVADVSATLKTPIPGIEWYRRHNNSPGDRRLPQFEIPPELVVAMAIAIAAAGIKCGCDDPGLAA